jgi:hypothetical protein
MDNSGNGRLRVPGYGGIPVDFQLPGRERFAHGFEDFRQTPAITAREMAMVEAMNLITDEPAWHERIFDDSAAESLADEARTRNRLVGKRAWKWCLAELRGKAIEYRDQRFVRVLDMGSCACKSDELVPNSVSEDIKTAMDSLFTKQPQDQTVFHPVDPEMYAFEYGKTHVLDSGGCVELSAFTPGDLKQPEPAYSSDDIWQHGHDDDEGCFRDIRDEIEKSFRLHSESYQRLPCDLKFVGSGIDVEITSYINNVHPSHVSFYKSIEKLVSCSVPLWNSCLIHGTDPRPDDCGWRSINRNGDQIQQGRIPLRIVCFGAVWKDQLRWSSGIMGTHFMRGVKAYNWAKKEIHASRPKKLRMFEHLWDAKAIVRRFKWVENLPPIDVSQATPMNHDPDERHKLKWKHPQPGRAFSYAEWKAGEHIDEAVVDMITRPSQTGRARLRPDHTRYEVRLEDEFRAKGLQVIVQVRGVNLPNQIYRGWSEDWRLEGVLNEHIVASTIYAYDAKDVDAKIRFRQETPMEPSVYRYEKNEGPAWSRDEDPSEIYWRDGYREDELDALVDIFGFDEASDIRECYGADRSTRTYQNLGGVALPQGRIMTFSNAVEHSFGMRLAPGKSTGHFRYVAVHLVDPNYRICSTKNVPPQQHYWWEHAAPDLLKQRGLPRELVDPIAESSRWSISEVEATKRRTRMLSERSALNSERKQRVGWFAF